MLSLADDFIKNDGTKFLDLMEQLAERKLRQFDIQDRQDEDDDEEDDDDEIEDGEMENK